VRSGRWLIPAFHVAIDSDIRGGHDDPQNFDVDAFAGGIERLMARLARPPQANQVGVGSPAGVVAQGDYEE
jgi:hypothetical protein